MKEHQAATERHVRMVVAAQHALAVQLRATLEVTTAPTALPELKAIYTGGAGLQRALVEGREAIRLIASVVETERLLLALTTSIEELREDRRQDQDAEVLGRVKASLASLAAARPRTN